MWGKICTIPGCNSTSCSKIPLTTGSDITKMRCFEVFVKSGTCTHSHTLLTDDQRDQGRKALQLLFFWMYLKNLQQCRECQVHHFLYWLTLILVLKFVLVTEDAQRCECSIKAGLLLGAVVLDDEEYQIRPGMRVVVVDHHLQGFAQLRTAI